jgi:hypothetical protein
MPHHPVTTLRLGWQNISHIHIIKYDLLVATDGSESNSDNPGLSSSAAHCNSGHNFPILERLQFQDGHTHHLGIKCMS